MKKLTMEQLERLSTEDFKEKTKIPITIVLDNVRSLHNVGSAFRTADAFLVNKLILCGITGTPPNREIQKTALGATETVDWSYEENTLSAIKKLKEQGNIICVIEQVDKKVFLHDFNPEKEKKYALVFGNEVFGVEDEVILESDYAIEIPQFGTKHSLNVSVSLGIVLWDFIVKRGMA